MIFENYNNAIYASHIFHLKFILDIITFDQWF